MPEPLSVMRITTLSAKGIGEVSIWDWGFGIMEWVWAFLVGTFECAGCGNSLAPQEARSLRNV